MLALLKTLRSRGNPKTHRDTFQTPGQRALLQELRMQNNPRMDEIVKAASIDDLEWFRQMLDLILDETPHWIKDATQREKSQAWMRRVRTMTTGVLHNKQVADRPRKLAMQIGGKVIYLFGSAVVGVVVGWFMKGWLG